MAAYCPPGPVMPGKAVTAPAKGTSGPGDGGRSDGTKHYAHPAPPVPNKPRPGATKGR